MNSAVKTDLIFAARQAPSRIIGVTPCPIVRGRIHPQATFFHLADGRITAVFDGRPKYYLDQKYRPRPISEIAIRGGNRNIVLDVEWAWERAHPSFLRWLGSRQWNIGSPLQYAHRHASLTAPYSGVPLHEYARMDTGGPFNPDADPESSTVDGDVSRQGQASWAAAQGTAAGTHVTSSGGTMIAGSLENTGSGSYWIYRLAALFDTSSLGSGAESTEATFEGYVSGKADTDNDAQAYVNLVQSSPASNTTLAVGDYDAIGDSVDNPTVGATAIDISGVSTSAYKAWTLNSTGLGWIDPDGITKLGLREGHDMEDASIILNGNSRLNFDTADGTNAPKLTITFTPGFVPGPFGLI